MRIESGRIRSSKVGVSVGASAWRRCGRGAWSLAVCEVRTGDDVEVLRSLSQNLNHGRLYLVGGRVTQIVFVSCSTFTRQFSIKTIRLV